MQSQDRDHSSVCHGLSHTPTASVAPAAVAVVAVEGAAVVGDEVPAEIVPCSCRACIAVKFSLGLSGQKRHVFTVCCL